MEEFLEDDIPSGNKWSSRSLCGIKSNENHHLKAGYNPTENAKKTLLDYEKLIRVNNLESAADDCSLTPHIRVKRRNALQHENNQYLNQLAESFPRDSFSDSNITKSKSKNGSYEFIDNSFTTDILSAKCNRTVRSLSQKPDCNNIEADNVINNQNKIKDINVHPHKRHLGRTGGIRREGVRENKKSTSNRKRKNRNRKIKRADVKSSCISRTTNVYQSDTANKLNNYETSPSTLSTNNQVLKNEESDNNEKNYYSIAIESAEEVEDLAKKLVVKVDELENYLRYKKESINNKRIDVPAIDDLCLNVTAAYKWKKEPTKVIRRCLPAPKTRFRVKPKAALKRNVNARGEIGSELVENGRVEKSKKKRFYKMKIRRDTEEESHQKWGRWTDWSSCSVTCGKGRQIRWRYCLNDDCSAEIEMGEKACQLPACPPRRFLGIF